MSILDALALEHCHNSNCRNRTLRMRFSPSRGIVLNGEWLCSAPCFQAGIEAHCGSMMIDVSSRKQARYHRIPLGLLLMSRGQIAPELLREALGKQEKEGGRIGDVLCRMGAVTEQQITSAVATQWGCPVFALRDHPGASHHASLLPLALLRKYRAFPVHFSHVSRVLHVAFAQEVSSRLLYVAQQMLSCSTEACIADESSILTAIEQSRQKPERSEFILAKMSGVAEIGRNAVNYARELGATGARLLVCDDFFWLRLSRRDKSSDFLFQLAATSVGERAPDGPRKETATEPVLAATGA